MLNYKIGVVGAGRIGGGQATLTSGHGCSTVVVDAYQQGLDNCKKLMAENFDELVREGLAAEENKAAALSRVTYTLDYNQLKDCDLIIEAVLEQMEVKREVYGKIEAAVGPDTPIASTTSALSADLLAELLERPERFVVAHPFQPAHMLPLVELVANAKTSGEVLTLVKNILEELDREVVVLHKSVPGFLVNRYAQALFRESIYLIEQGVVDVTDVDKAIKYAVGMRYASIGLMEYFDDVGFKLESEIAESCYPDLCDTKELQKTVVDGLASGKTGRAAGQGLYDWSKIDQADYDRRKSAPFYGCFNWNMPVEPIK